MAFPTADHAAAPLGRFPRAGTGPSPAPLKPWPLTGLLALLPLWWVSGLATLVFLLAPIWMVAQLRRRRPVALPPGFGLWLLFLATVLVSVGLVGVNPVGTVANSFASRIPGVMFRVISYASITVIFVYAYNLTESELSRVRLIRLLGIVFLTTVAGGFLGLLAPRLTFPSAIELLLPGGVRKDAFVQSLVHPAAAQLQEVFGYSTPRPAAPFGYTNTWGNSLSVLLPWFVVGFGLVRGVRHRWLAFLSVAAALVPVVYSLNRGLWVGLTLSAAYVTVRNVIAGRLASFGAVVVALSLVIIAATTTPIAGVLSQRLDNGQSNDIRVFTTRQTLQIVRQSPLLGFGSTRQAVGSSQSIAVGASADCQKCGNPTIGSNGQIWLNLVAQGGLGTFFYAAFFIYGVWRFRRDRTLVGQAGILVLLLALLYMFFYNALVQPLCFYLLSYAILARNERSARLSSSASSGRMASRAAGRQPLPSSYASAGS